jgi:methylamine dehydrogenase heavy chain
VKHFLAGLLVIAVWIGAPPLAAGEDPVEQAGVATLPPQIGAHWVWVPDRLLQHSILFDGDSGDVLGMIDSAASLTPKAPVHAGGRFFSADIAYSRGTRGERVDFVSVYDARTLAYEDEIMLPTRAGQSNASLAYAELLGERFFAIFNQFPNISVSIVDLEKKRFVEEIVIAGCSGVYPVDERHFATLCGNGTTALVALDENGHKVGMTPSNRFFDPVEDPVAMAGGRNETRWTFVSFEGLVYTVDYASGTPRVDPSWSLLDDADRRRDWRPGGLQHVAMHAPTNRLFVAMHRGGAGSHKQAGPEIWVFDVDEKKRVARFEPPNLTAAFLSGAMGTEPGSFLDRLMHWTLPSEGVHALVVSQDEEPLLFARNSQLGAVAVMDATTGETLRFLTEAGLAGPTLRVP